MKSISFLSKTPRAFRRENQIQDFGIPIYLHFRSPMDLIDDIDNLLDIENEQYGDVPEPESIDAFIIQITHS